MSAVSNGRAFHYHLMGYWMTMELDREEPSAGRWRVERIADVVNAFAERARTGAGRPLVLAIDGRSSSGKTTLAGRVADTVPATAVVRTDDIAWSYSRFGWADLALRVLELVHAGAAVSFRPPKWDERGRAGAIVVPGGTQILVLEGVGSSREELAHLLDARLWVQADRIATDRRNDSRVAAGGTTRAGVEGWMAEELPFIAARRPWEHADLIVAGTPTLPHDPRTEIAVADGPLR
jgi:hypothetical protein